MKQYRMNMINCLTRTTFCNRLQFSRKVAPLPHAMILLIDKVSCRDECGQTENCARTGRDGFNVHKNGWGWD